MRVTLKTSAEQREFIVKIQYDLTKPKTAVKYGRDEHGRDYETTYTWCERVTTVSIQEWFKESNPKSRTVFQGKAICDYHDNKRYRKRKGKLLAYKAALDEMHCQGVINDVEYDALLMLELSATAYEIDLAATATIKRIM